MNCKNCGNVISGEDKFCPNCGQAVEVSTEPVKEEKTAPVVETPAPVTEPVQQAPVTPVAETPAPAAAPTPAINDQVIGVYQTTDPKKSNGAFIIIVIVLALIIVGLGVFIGIKLLGNNESGNTSSNTNTNDSQVVENNTNNDSNNSYNSNNTYNNESNTTTPTTTTTADNTINLGDYVLTLPAGIEKSGNIYGNSEFAFNIDSKYVSYSRLNSALPSIKEMLSENGITVISEKEYTFGTRKYYIMEVSNGQAKEDVYFTELDSLL